MLFFFFNSVAILCFYLKKKKKRLIKREILEKALAKMCPKQFDPHKHTNILVLNWVVNTSPRLPPAGSY